MSWELIKSFGIHGATFVFGVMAGALVMMIRYAERMNGRYASDDDDDEDDSPAVSSKESSLSSLASYRNRGRGKRKNAPKKKAAPRILEL